MNIKQKKALIFAKRKHKGQIRKDGSPYINHPIRVANKVSNYKTNKSTSDMICASYLHDTLEDTDTTYEELVSEFGSSIASIVLEVTTNNDMKKEIGKTNYLKYKMKSMSSWALIIKLCDRLDNVADLVNTSDEVFKKRYIKETKDILKYVKENRSLTNIHESIMNEILEKLEIVDR